MDLYTQITRVESWHCGPVRRVGRQDQDMGFARDIAVACHGGAVLKFTLLAMDAAKLRCDIDHPPTGDEPEDEDPDATPLDLPVPEGTGVVTR